jgi:hypothetical protein
MVRPRPVDTLYINFVQKRIPRDKHGVPCFATIKQVVDAGFTEHEVVAIMNRYIDDADYHRDRKRTSQREERVRIAPLRAKLREMFNKKLEEATNEELVKAAMNLNNDAKPNATDQK